MICLLAFGAAKTNAERRRLATVCVGISVALQCNWNGNNKTCKYGNISCLIHCANFYARIGAANRSQTCNLATTPNRIGNSLPSWLVVRLVAKVAWGRRVCCILCANGYVCMQVCVSVCYRFTFIFRQVWLKGIFGKLIRNHFNLTSLFIKYIRASCTVRQTLMSLFSATYKYTHTERPTDTIYVHIRRFLVKLLQIGQTCWRRFPASDTCVRSSGFGMQQWRHNTRLRLPLHRHWTLHSRCGVWALPKIVKI